MSDFYVELNNREHNMKNEMYKSWLPTERTLTLPAYAETLHNSTGTNVITSRCRDRETNRIRVLTHKSNMCDNKGGN